MMRAGPRIHSDEEHRFMRKCERCQQNPARVRVDQFVNGKREEHYLCQSCVDELMSTMGQMGGPEGFETPDAPLGFFANNNRSSSAANGMGGVNTATAEQRAKNSKTPTLDQYGVTLPQKLPKANSTLRRG